ncbi:MAG TPA: hypothetical protein DCE08_03750 [Ruminococcaceae bacterium]|nr:hypothetical protein [Oscillospiraceae bacterium]
MRKFVSLLLVFATLFTFAACGETTQAFVMESGDLPMGVSCEKMQVPKEFTQTASAEEVRDAVELFGLLICRDGWTQAGELSFSELLAVCPDSRFLNSTLDRFPRIYDCSVSADALEAFAQTHLKISAKSLRKTPWYDAENGTYACTSARDESRVYTKTGEITAVVRQNDFYRVEWLGSWVGDGFWAYRERRELIFFKNADQTFALISSRELSSPETTLPPAEEKTISAGDREITVQLPPQTIFAEEENSLYGLKFLIYADDGFPEEIGNSAFTWYTEELNGEGNPLTLEIIRHSAKDSDDGVLRASYIFRTKTDPHVMIALTVDSQKPEESARALQIMSAAAKTGRASKRS